MIVQFDRHKAAQGAGPADHVWKIALNNTEMATLHGIMEAARRATPVSTEVRALTGSVLHSLRSVLQQSHDGKPFPIATVDTSAVAKHLSPLPVVLTGQGEYAQAWPHGCVPPVVSPACIPYPEPEHGGHARYCPKN